MQKIRDIDKIELNESYNKVIQWFFSYPLMHISLSELAREVAISKKTANVVVSQLIKEEFLIKEEIGRVWRITCNQKHIYNFTRKISYNLSMVYQLLYEGGVINDIYKKVGNTKAIILFGSYRKGDDNEKSDIDLAIEVIGKENLKIINLGVISKFGYRKNVPVNIHIFSRDKIDINLFSNITNGIVLEGFLEVKV
ncbi:MAG: nucleotidyltransferase domain-containing protein [Candidatus Pacearchaeota archaeon]|jgi:predicted nucleotidyltransferase